MYGGALEGLRFNDNGTVYHYVQNGGDFMKKPLLLYVEEQENDFATGLIRRNDINLALIRLSNCMHFEAAISQELVSARVESAKFDFLVP